MKRLGHRLGKEDFEAKPKDLSAEAEDSSAAAAIEGSLFRSGLAEDDRHRSRGESELKATPIRHGASTIEEAASAREKSASAEAEAAASAEAEEAAAASADEAEGVRSKTKRPHVPQRPDPTPGLNSWVESIGGLGW